MAQITKTIHVKVLTYDPAQATMIPVPNARLLCEDSSWLWDPNLSSGNDTTDAQGQAQVQITYDEGEENSLNPYFTITIPSSDRKQPASAPAEKQVELPDEWVTRHYVQRRIPRIAEHSDPNHPLELFVGLPASLRVAYTDFDPVNIRNPLALPEDTARVYLADYDTFLWIDFLNPDDTLKGFGYNRPIARTVRVGDEDRYPYFNAFPTAASAFDGIPPTPRAWIDPPGAPVGTLGGASFEQVGPLAVDVHGFVFMIDNNQILRFYPDGTLSETIPSPGAGLAMNNPSGLALDQHRNLYIADTGNDRIVIFRWGGYDGEGGRYIHVGNFGGSGAGNGQFSAPVGLAIIPNRVVDSPEFLVVADSGNARVQVLRINLPGAAAPGVPNPSQRAMGYRLQPGLSFSAAFGSAGAGAGQFTTPKGVAADRQRRIFVCDEDAHRLSRWLLDAAGTNVTLEVTWEKAGGGAGNGDGEFDRPKAIALDTKNNAVYVVEAGNQRIQRLDADSGAHQLHWIHAYTPPLTHPFAPAAVALDARGEVYAADSANLRLLRATTFAADGSPLPDGSAPQLVGSPWLPRSAQFHMRRPGYLVFDRDGKLWVSDTENNRILVYARDIAGALMITAGPPADGLDRPVGLALDPEGNLFVVDAGNERIRRYDAALAHQADFGTSGAGDGQFDDPHGLAIAAPDGVRIEPILYVADTGNNRVQAFKRDGSFVKALATGGGQAFSAPEDVAVDAQGNLYIADTGNARIVQFDAHDAFVRSITLSSHGQSFRQPCGVSIDDQGKLIVADRAENKVFRLEAGGVLLAFWDLEALVEQEFDPKSFHRPDLARLQVFNAPARAVIDGRGLLAVADTGNHRVRLARTYTQIDVNLFDLGEGLPDISFRLVTKANWRDSLGLKLNVGDVSIFDESQDFVSDPEDDFSLDRYIHHQMIGKSNSTNAAINVMKVVRRTQQWYQHHTRQDPPEHRWGNPDHGRELNVDLIASDGSYQFLDVNMGETDHEGRNSDAWDDSVVAHEMTHWVFFKALLPYPPFTLMGLIQLSGSHSSAKVGSYNQALTEGWAEFVESMWGSQFGSTDRLRGFRMGDSPGNSETLTYVKPKDHPAEYLFGGPVSNPLPAFDAPGRALQNEGYFSNALYQLDRLLTDPSVLFADAPSYWHRYNARLSDVQSQRFCDTIWKGLRIFEEDPPIEDLDRGTQVYLRQVLRQFHNAQPGFAQMAQSIFELNNLLVPAIALSQGGNETAPGSPLGETTTLKEGESLDLTLRIADATGMPLKGYQLNLDPGADLALVSPPASAEHGRAPAGLNVVSNAHGIVNVRFTAPPGSAGTTRTIHISYQPDFDADSSFAPPVKADDLETTLRKLCLYELRAAAKIWEGNGNNWGAKVAKTLRIEIKAP